jgi:cytochrome c-type biogenesis protein CcmH
VMVRNSSTLAAPARDESAPRTRTAARRGWRMLLAAGILAAATATLAKEAAPVATDPVLEARMVRIASELRCLVCQNQTIADSNAPLAVDLRKQAREMLQQGKSDAEVIDYMTARYGDFVLYRPPLRATTALLWFGPALLLGVGGAVLVMVLRRRSRMAADAFDPDEDDADMAETAAREAAANAGAPGRA